jgi:Arm DNA-binding domain
MVAEAGMARTAGGLTALKVGRLVGKPGMHADGGGLYLQVTAGGASWIYRYMLNGRAREMGLGPLALFGLQEARAKALDARRLRHGGIDPIEARRAARQQARLHAAKAITFKQCAESYIKAHRAGWRNGKHAAQWEATLATYAEPIIGALPVQTVDTALVLKAIEPLWTTKPETASRLRGRIESILDWASAREYRAGENPPAGAAISTNCCRPGARCAGSNITPHCLMPSWRTLWLRCASKRALPPARWNF